MNNFEYWHDRATREAQAIKSKCMTVLQAKVLCDCAVVEQSGEFTVSVKSFGFSAWQLPPVEGKAKTLAHAWRIALARRAKIYRTWLREFYPELL